MSGKRVCSIWIHEIGWWSLVSWLDLRVIEVFTGCINIHASPCWLGQSEVLLFDSTVFPIILLIKTLRTRYGLVFARVIDKWMTWKHSIHVLWNWIALGLLVVRVVQLIWRQTVWIFIYIGFRFVLKGWWIDLGWIVGLENWLQDFIPEIWIVVFHVIESSHTLRYFLLWQTDLIIAFSVDAIALRYWYADVFILQ